MSTSAARPAIYVGSLLDLNNGITHGVWIDAELPVPSILLAITDMLECSPTTTRTGEPAEAWLILDSEGFSERIDPHESLDAIRSLAGLRGSRTKD